MVPVNRFNTIINLFVNTFLCVELTAFALWKQNSLYFEPFAISFIIAFGIGYLGGDLLPLKSTGDRVAAGIGLKQGFTFYTFSTFVVSLIMTLFMSIIMTFVNIGFAPFYWQAWWGLFPYLLGMAFVTELICVPVAVRLAMKLTDSETQGNPIPQK